jgi:hypothetical protein
MIETIDRSYEPNTENLIKAAAEYLRESPLGRNADVVRAELIDLIGKQERLSTLVIQNALRSADIEVVHALKARGVDLNSSPNMRSMSVFSFSGISTARRTEMFNLVSKDIDPEERNVRRVISEAISVRDPALLDAVLAWAPDHSFEEILLSLGRLESETSVAPHFWRNIVDRVSPDSDDVHDYAAKWLTIRPSARSLAVMAAKGLRLAPIIAQTSVSEKHANPWLLRLRARAGSAHGEMELKRTLPGVDEILVMPLGQIEVLLAGLSNNQKRKLQRAERKGRVPQSLRELKAITDL